MNLRPFTLLFVLVLLGMEILSCSRIAKGPELPLGRPVALSLGISDARHSLSEFILSVRAPGTSAWTARFAKDSTGDWRITTDQDDLANPNLLNHFLEILETFTTESEAGHAEESSLGLNPFRFEARLKTNDGEKILRLGDSAGQNGIYFQASTDASKENLGKIWIGRGALIAFLPSLETLEGLRLPFPYRIPLEKIRTLTLTRESSPSSKTWAFDRKDGKWLNAGKPVSDSLVVLLERILHQRILRTVPSSELTIDAKDLNTDLKTHDWQITLKNEGGEQESLKIRFHLNSVLGLNPSRSSKTLELYPEMAGALRAFTQSGFTPLRSGIK